MDIKQLWFMLWRLRDGDNTLLYRFPLTKESVVVDGGGYVGEWSQGIIDRYNCRVLLFEPQERYAMICLCRFKGKNVEVFQSALSDSNHRTTMDDAGIGAGIEGVYNRENDEHLNEYYGGTTGEIVRAVDTAKALPKNVDLLKLNIEGGEYEVLYHLDEQDRLKDIRFLLIQFHYEKGGSVHKTSFGEMRANPHVKILRQILTKTHKLLWRYPGVWEAWVRK